MTVWKPATCNCIVEFNAALTNIVFHKICEGHKKLNKAPASVLFNEVLDHNHAYAFKYGASPTQAEIDLVAQESAAEKARSDDPTYTLVKPAQVKP